MLADEKAHRPQFALSEDQQVTRLDLFVKQFTPIPAGMQTGLWKVVSPLMGQYALNLARCSTWSEPGDSCRSSQSNHAQAQAIELDILFEDASTTVINKPANLVVTQVREILRAP